MVEITKEAFVLSGYTLQAINLLGRGEITDKS